MAEACIDEICEVELGSGSKITAFDLAINMSDRFEILGLNTAEDKFVLKDVTLSDGVHGRYIEIDVTEVVDKPLKDILDVLNGRNDVVVKGYSRIVGYYSAVSNWNSSKIGELRDRANGEYGTGKYETNNQDERMMYINNH